MSTTAALMDGHWLTTWGNIRDAKCECGEKFDWENADAEHVRHLLAVAWDEGLHHAEPDGLGDHENNPYRKAETKGGDDMTTLEPNGEYPTRFEWTITVDQNSSGWDWDITGPDGTESWTDPDLLPGLMNDLLTAIRTGDYDQAILAHLDNQTSLDIALALVTEVAQRIRSGEPTNLALERES